MTSSAQPGAAVPCGRVDLSRDIDQVTPGLIALRRQLHHRPGFDIDEDALSLGVHIMSLAALDLLE